MRIKSLSAGCFALAATTAWGFEGVEAVQTEFNSPESVEQVVLQNDGFNNEGGQAYLQLGFVEGEMAGVWVQVPQQYDYFKIEYFRVLMGSAQNPFDSEVSSTIQQVFFQMGVSSLPGTASPRDIENAAQITPGPYWNDIPAQGADRQLRCARAGEYIGAALEFTHSGAPSVYRDIDGLSNIKHNTLYAIPGGWAYSVQYGLRGDWILRIVGHPATEEECK